MMVVRLTNPSLFAVVKDGTTVQLGFLVLLLSLELFIELWLLDWVIVSLLSQCVSSHYFSSLVASNKKCDTFFGEDLRSPRSFARLSYFFRGAKLTPFSFTPSFFPSPPPFLLFEQREIFPPFWCWPWRLRSLFNNNISYRSSWSTYSFSRFAPQPPFLL